MSGNVVRVRVEDDVGQVDLPTAAEIPAWLLEHTQKTRWRRARIAKLCGVSRQAVAQWVNGQSTPSLHHLILLVRTLGTPSAPKIPVVVTPEVPIAGDKSAIQNAEDLLLSFAVPAKPLRKRRYA